VPVLLSRRLQLEPLRQLHAEHVAAFPGGPVACQGISLNGFKRRIYGRWEFEQNTATASLLTWPYGKSVGMPVVLAVFPK